MHTATTTYKAFSQNRLGRFLSPDPYGQFYSAYTGMGNNPVNLVDPSGGWSHGDIEAVDIVAEMPAGVGTHSNSMYVKLKKMEVALTYMDAIPEVVSFWASSWIIRNMSPYPISGSQPSNSGEGGPDDGSTSIAAGSNRGMQSGSASPTSVISGTKIVTSNPGREENPNAINTNSEGNPPRDIEEIARELANDPADLDLMIEYYKCIILGSFYISEGDTKQFESGLEIKYDFNDGIGMRSSAAVEGYISFDGETVRVGARVLHAEKFINYNYWGNIRLKVNGKEVDYKQIIEPSSEGHKLRSPLYVNLGEAEIDVPKNGKVQIEIIVGYEVFTGHGYNNGTYYKKTFTIKNN